MKDLYQLRKLIPKATDQSFLKSVFQVKQVRPGDIAREGRRSGVMEEGRVIMRGKG